MDTDTAIHSCGLDGVLRDPQKALHAQVLVDLFEEQRDLPAALIEAARRKHIKSVPVGDEHQGLVGLRISVADAPQAVGVVRLGSHVIQSDGLIGDDAERSVCCIRVEAMEPKVRLGAGDEEDSGLVQCVQALEVNVGAVHSVSGTCFGDRQVEHADIVELPSEI